MSSVTFGGTDPDLATISSVLEVEGVSLDGPVRRSRTRLDTFDGLLHAAGLRLERRSVHGPGTSPCQLVLTGAGAAAHLPVPAPVDPDAPLAPHDLPPGPLRLRLIEICEPRVLLPQITVTSVHQHGCREALDGRPRVLAHLDASFEVAGAQMPQLSVEVEALPGDPKPARMLGKRLEEHGLTAHRGDVLDLATAAAGIDPVGWQGASKPRLDRHAPALAGFRAVLRSFAENLETNWDGTAAHLDSEFLHDLRIAVRQTRSLLTQGKDVLPVDVRTEQEQVFRWLGGLTSPSRDLDVYVEGWSGLIGGLTAEEQRSLDPVLAHLIEHREDAHSEVTDELRSDHTVVLRERWHTWLALADDAVEGGPDAEVALGVAASTRIRKAQRRVITDGRRIGPESRAEDLHQLRKDAKRLRYLLESFGDLGGRKRKQQMVGHLKKLQDNLGAHQDAEVQADRLREAVIELAEDGPPPPIAVAALERLATELDTRQAEERVAFDATFAAYDSKTVRRTLQDLRERMAR